VVVKSEMVKKGGQCFVQNYDLADQGVGVRDSCPDIKSIGEIPSWAQNGRSPTIAMLKKIHSGAPEPFHVFVFEFIKSGDLFGFVIAP
jgi:hypothetical protein